MGQNKSQQVFLGLGGNLGDVQSTFLNVQEDLLARHEIESLEVSPLYRSAPWGGDVVDVSAQQDYFNQVFALQTSLSAIELLKICQQLEDKAGRDRSTARWSARVLDIDILLYGQQQINRSDLIIPHAYMLQRAFVLKPLFDLDPECYIPGFGKVSQALDELSLAELQSLSLIVV